MFSFEETTAAISIQRLDSGQQTAKGVRVGIEMNRRHDWIVTLRGHVTKKPVGLSLGGNPEIFYGVPVVAISDKRKTRTST
ncbi:MAG: hypothetical protein AB1813_07825, partial [Verrucomicrobiota bacterium]